jgi:hypothetical protein
LGGSSRLADADTQEQTNKKQKQKCRSKLSVMIEAIDFEWAASERKKTLSIACTDTILENRSTLNSPEACTATKKANTYQM